MKKTTKLVGKPVETEGQQHIVDTLLSELYGIKVPQGITCEDCGNKFELRRCKYVLQDDESMATAVMQHSEQSVRARYAPVNGTFPVRVFTFYYFDCPYCKKRYFTRAIDPYSYNVLSQKHFFDLVDVFENGLFVLPDWKLFGKLKECIERMDKIERRTTGRKLEDKNTGLTFRLEFFHG